MASTRRSKPGIRSAMTPGTAARSCIAMRTRFLLRCVTGFSLSAATAAMIPAISNVSSTPAICATSVSRGWVFASSSCAFCNAGSTSLYFFGLSGLALSQRVNSASSFCFCSTTLSRRNAVTDPSKSFSVFAMSKTLLCSLICRSRFPFPSSCNASICARKRLINTGMNTSWL